MKSQFVPRVVLLAIGCSFIASTARGVDGVIEISGDEFVLDTGSSFADNIVSNDGNGLPDDVFTGFANIELRGDFEVSGLLVLQANSDSQGATTPTNVTPTLTWEPSVDPECTPATAMQASPPGP